MNEPMTRREAPVSSIQQIPTSRPDLYAFAADSFDGIAYEFPE